MATISIDIPDALIAYYETTRATYNPWAAKQGAPSSPPATKAALTKLLMDIIKNRVVGEAVRINDPNLEVLQTALAAL
jgi:hypothetical protein